MKKGATLFAVLWAVLGLGLLREGEKYLGGGARKIEI